jgi:SPP1 gp7 family putative phage head morphogenesis protein
VSQGKLLQTIAHFRRLLLQRNAQAEQALTAAYRTTLATIKPQLDHLYQHMQTRRDAGEDVSLNFLYEANRMERLTTFISHEVNQYGSLALSHTNTLQHQAITLGGQSALSQLHSLVPDGVHWSFGRPSPDAIANLVGASASGSPLSDLFNGFGKEAAKGVKDALVTGVSLGNNPRRIAPQVEQVLQVPRYRALVIARTEAARAYRTANLQTFKANDDVVKQWRWTSAKSIRSCAACLGMDGSLHDLDEDMGSHPSCMCVMSPLTKSWDEILSPLGIDTSDISDTQPEYESGADWFDKQDEKTQRGILGSDKAYELYASGTPLKSFVGHASDQKWGDSIYQKPLKDMAKGQTSQEPATKPSMPAFPQGKDAQDVFLKQSQAHAIQSLTNAERESVKEYTYLNYRDINPALRHPEDVAKEDRKWIDEEIANLDKAVAKGSVPADMTSYRGIEAYGGTLDFFKQNVGNIISDNAFQSTSLDRERASMFADEGGAIVSVRIPKGTNGLYVSPLSEFDKGGDTATPEYEMLLPRGTKYKIVEHTPATEAGKEHFVFEVVP